MKLTDSRGLIASSTLNSSPLVLTLLGVPRVQHRGQPLHLTRSQTRAVLFRLGVQLEPMSSDELSSLFWPEIANSVVYQTRVKCRRFVDVPLLR